MLRLKYKRIKANYPKAIICYAVNDFMHVSGERDVGVVMQMCSVSNPQCNNAALQIIAGNTAKWHISNHDLNIKKLEAAGFKVIVL